jgi:hypothetical protein
VFQYHSVAEGYFLFFEIICFKNAALHSAQFTCLVSNWHILPNHKEVHVYTGDKLDKMTVCTGQTVCSAAPILPGFALPAEEIFKKAPIK